MTFRITVNPPMRHRQLAKLLIPPPTGQVITVGEFHVGGDAVLHVVR